MHALPEQEQEFWLTQTSKRAEAVAKGFLTHEEGINCIGQTPERPCTAFRKMGDLESQTEICIIEQVELMGRARLFGFSEAEILEELNSFDGGEKAKTRAEKLKKRGA